MRSSAALLALHEDSPSLSCAEQVQQRFNCSQPGCGDQIEDTGCLINYIMLHQCTLGSVPWLGWIVLGTWLLYLIYLLGNTADAFFCPALEVIVAVLKLSPNVAGTHARRAPLRPAPSHTVPHVAPPPPARRQV